MGNKQGCGALTFKLKTVMLTAFKNSATRMRFPLDVILICIRWYAAYPLNYRHLEEMMHERGVIVDHSSITRWAIKFLPLLEKICGKHKRRVGGSWRMDETYIKVKRIWKYLYRAGNNEAIKSTFC